ncbi:hypothetical protein RRG08_021939 [Elysia crispata]|uniref:Uncharacterized protein n=1 Tax=Elysia crispata TaxID=231223 RepID=A0AAE1AC35_9GAST|nr:hypothetical protein RRG08_021939 [Elysia crispata]
MRELSTEPQAVELIGPVPSLALEPVTRYRAVTQLGWTASPGAALAQCLTNLKHLKHINRAPVEQGEVVKLRLTQSRTTDAKSLQTFQFRFPSSSEPCERTAQSMTKSRFKHYTLSTSHGRDWGRLGETSCGYSSVSSPLITSKAQGDLRNRKYSLYYRVVSKREARFSDAVILALRCPPVLYRHFKQLSLISVTACTATGLGLSQFLE